MFDHELRLMKFLGVTKLDEDLMNQRASELFEELDTTTDIRKCVTHMKETYVGCGSIDRAFAFYLLLSKEHFDSTKRCIDEVKETGTLSKKNIR